MAKVPMTVEGAQRLKVELHRLKTIERPAVIQAIAEARTHGDLSENADIKLGKISVSSPIARALIGKSEGETADVQAPGGLRSYEILAVRYV